MITEEAGSEPSSENRHNPRGFDRRYPIGARVRCAAAAVIRVTGFGVTGAGTALILEGLASHDHHITSAAGLAAASAGLVSVFYLAPRLRDSVAAIRAAHLHRLPARSLAVRAKAALAGGVLAGAGAAGLLAHAADHASRTGLHPGFFGFGSAGLAVATGLVCRFFELRRISNAVAGEAAPGGPGRADSAHRAPDTFPLAEDAAPPAPAGPVTAADPAGAIHTTIPAGSPAAIPVSNGAPRGAGVLGTMAGELLLGVSGMSAAASGAIWLPIHHYLKEPLQGAPGLLAVGFGMVAGAAALGVANRRPLVSHLERLSVAGLERWRAAATWGGRLMAGGGAVTAAVSLGAFKPVAVGLGLGAMVAGGRLLEVNSAVAHQLGRRGGEASPPLL